MKIGVSLSNYGSLPSREFLKDSATDVENQELDSIWVSDHIIVPKKNDPWTRVFESVSTLGFLTSITDKVQLGTSIILIPLRDPMILAKQIATLDSLSKGRIVLGVGIGWNKEEFQMLGKNFENRKTTIAKNLKIMRDFWGKKYSNQGYSNEPIPSTEGGPPILIGGQSKGALNRVVSIGDGWHPVGISPEQYQLGIQEITGIKERDYIWSLRINFAANVKIESQYIGADGEKRLRITGSTDETILQIQEYQKVGIEHIVCDIKADSKKEYLEQIRILGEIKNSF